jgi:hypothetical protein
MHDLLLFTKMHGLKYCYLSLDKQLLVTWLHKSIVIIHVDDTILDTYLSLGSGLMISIMTLENLVVEQKL